MKLVELSIILMAKIKIKIKHYGADTSAYLNSIKNIEPKLRQIGEDSLDDFEKSSPNTEIASGWSYELKKEGSRYMLSFNNDNANVAVLIDVGHATYDGKWVSGKHYLKEPISKVYERIDKMLQEVK